MGTLRMSWRTKYGRLASRRVESKVQKPEPAELKATDEGFRNSSQPVHQPVHAASPVMDVIEQRFDVGYRYRVFFTRDLFGLSNRIVREVVTADNKLRPKLLAVADRGLLDHHPELEAKLLRYAEEYELQLVGSVIQLPGGELVKQTAAGVERVLEAIHQRGIDRHSYLLAIGGGALLDAVGYAAAIAHRGVRLIRIPTTVLAQNDSGVGVKNAINAFAASACLLSGMMPAANSVTMFRSPGRKPMMSQPATCSNSGFCCTASSASPEIMRLAEKPPAGGYLVFGFIASAMPMRSRSFAK